MNNNHTTTPGPDPYARERARARIAMFDHTVSHGMQFLTQHAFGYIRSYATDPDPRAVQAALQATTAAVDEVREVHRIDGVRGLQAALDQARAELGGGRS